jgi:hypothetical protein
VPAPTWQGLTPVPAREYMLPGHTCHHRARLLHATLTATLVERNHRPRGALGWLLAGTIQRIVLQAQPVRGILTVQQPTIIVGSGLQDRVVLR